MGLIKTIPPAVVPLSLAEAKAIARVDGAEDDALLAGYIRSATASIEQYLGMALITSSWTYKIDHFPSCRWGNGIRLPLAPVQAVTEISYLDTTGAVQVPAPAVYTVTGIGDVARISLAQGQSWPATRWHDEAITVDFIAGFGGSWNDTPEPIRTAIGEAVRSMFDGCGPVIPEELVQPYRVVPV